MPPVAPTFTERLAERQRRWWQGRHARRWERGVDAVHRAVERASRRHRDDPEETWRCCPYWQRTVINKWNGREFAARHGCTLPDLLWSGSDHRRIPWESLPEEFVIRPLFGAYDYGVAVVAGGRELLQDRPASSRALTAALPRTDTLRRPMPVLIEEYIHSDMGSTELPLEFKCHTFVDRVAAIETAERFTGDHSSHRFYTPDWTPIADTMYTGYEPPGEQIDRPAWLEEMLATAIRIGSAIGTYMRIDFFAGQGGFIFNEFSSVPSWEYPWTPYCDELFGRLWAECCPDAS